MKNIIQKMGFLMGFLPVVAMAAAQGGEVIEENVKRHDLRTLCFMGLRTPQGFYYGDCTREVNFLHQLSTDKNWVVAECRPVTGTECKQFEGWNNGSYQFADKILTTKLLVPSK
jgi:hypothetical protein